MYWFDKRSSGEAVQSLLDISPTSGYPLIATERVKQDSSWETGTSISEATTGNGNTVSGNTFWKRRHRFENPKFGNTVIHVEETGTPFLGSPFWDHQFREPRFSGAPIFGITVSDRKREHRFGSTNIRLTNLQLLVSPFDRSTGSFSREVERITVHLKARFTIAKVRVRCEWKRMTSKEVGASLVRYDQRERLVFSLMHPRVARGT